MINYQWSQSLCPIPNSASTVTIKNTHLKWTSQYNKKEKGEETIFLSPLSTSLERQDTLPARFCPLLTLCDCVVSFTRVYQGYFPVLSNATRSGPTRHAPSWLAATCAPSTVKTGNHARSELGPFSSRGPRLGLLCLLLVKGVTGV